MRRWKEPLSEAEALDRAVRLHLTSRYLEELAIHSSDCAMLARAYAMKADAEMFADIGLGHFADEVPCSRFGSEPAC